jgi:hypothetical protein
LVRAISLTLGRSFAGVPNFVRIATFDQDQPLRTEGFRPAIDNRHADGGGRVRVDDSLFVMAEVTPVELRLVVLPFYRVSPSLPNRVIQVGSEQVFHSRAKSNLRTIG